MDFVRRVVEADSVSHYVKPNMGEVNADLLHIKLLRNNTFLTLTDSKGNVKLKASSGQLGGKSSRNDSEATAEHMGRMARTMGLKNVVVKVKGFMYFKKKRQAIMAWREGFTHGKGDLKPIVYVEDVTRRAHNGCRLPRKRRT